ncbi:hypothetical protein KGA66_27470 [Actinocrinis puniceicyclus]|uniref:Uncharacterized protein n=1 Tax=Actinocrinis puniceicyclus TaxID=977794 RepID=A0A8J7WUQ1_9ACTN|nr:hypothetical protein [Actinocrinis puniceicyclus]MBS2966807.1 hypothetical protein [Actinocrinis puniceicyclus]
MHRILVYLAGVVALGLFSLILNFLLIILKFGNIRSVLFVRKVVVLLRGVPDGMALTCTDKKVSALSFDSKANAQKVVPLYTGVLTWRGGPRLALRVRKSAKRQFLLRSTIFGLVFVPLILVGLWLTLFVSWKIGGSIVVLLAFHQWMPFYIWDYPAVSSLLHGD